MPYPTPNDPQLCSASGKRSYQSVSLVFFVAPRVRCDDCGRILGTTPTGKLYPHLKRGSRTRRSDRTRDLLATHEERARQQLAGATP